MKLFGWEFKRAQDEQMGQLPSAPSFVPAPDEDGGVSIPYGGAQSYYYDLGINNITNDAELISKYRELSIHPEIEEAIDDIVNQAIILDDPNKGPLSLNLDMLEVDDGFKQLVSQCYSKVIKLLKFNVRGQEIFREWYIDGRLAYHVIVDKDNPQMGIQELRKIDSLKLRKVREIGDFQDPDGHIIKDVINQYYLYSENGFSIKNADPSNLNNNVSMQAIKIANDSIVFCTSGIKDETNGTILSFLNGAMRPLNMLRSVEDASIIYTLVRAPQRRIFKPDVTGLPPGKAEGYVRNMMAMHKNTLKYNQSTGEVKDDRRWLTMIDDYWFPQKDGRGMTVDVLNGDKSFIEPDYLNIFEKKLYQALKVPMSRQASGATFMFGQGAEISRDELKFMKFIARLRMQFSQLILKCMKIELMLTNAVDENEWNQIEPFILFNYTEDSYFQEMKDQELMRQRAGTMNAISPYLSNLLSVEWAYKNIWQMTDDDIMQMRAQIASEGPIMNNDEE